MSPPESPLEVDDLVGEILVRLPPRPSSLPRASAVCARWHRIISDPQFLHRFRAHHRKPPLLGFFVRHLDEYSFDSALEAPDRIPAARFSMPQKCHDYWGFYGCRHGLAVFIGMPRDTVIVWDPLTGRHHRVAFPEWFPKRRRPYCRNATVLCDSDEEGHVHGDCFLGPFKLVLLRDDYSKRACAYIYESKYDAWRTFVPTIAIPSGIRAFTPSFLVQNALYWLLDDNTILELDLQSHRLDVIQKPRDTKKPNSQFFILRTTANKLGLAITRDERTELWERKTNYHGVVDWVLEKIVEWDKVLPHGASFPLILIEDFVEDTNMILLCTRADIFTIQLESMECTYLGKRKYSMYFSYTNFYTGLEQIAK